VELSDAIDFARTNRAYGMFSLTPRSGAGQE
jgi:hypothetical protein